MAVFIKFTERSEGPDLIMYYSLLIPAPHYSWSIPAILPTYRTEKNSLCNMNRWKILTRKRCTSHKANGQSRWDPHILIILLENPPLSFALTKWDTRNRSIQCLWVRQYAMLWDIFYEKSVFFWRSYSLNKLTSFLPIFVAGRIVGSWICSCPNPHSPQMCYFIW